MLERYGYLEQSLSQVLTTIESFVECVGIQSRSGGRYANAIRHVSLSPRLNFVKVSKSFSNKYRNTSS
jgi:hypothetical protein